MMTKLSHEAWESLACELPDDVQKYKLFGDFQKAKETIDRWLSLPVAEVLKTRMLLEKKLLDLLEEDFPYTEEETIRLFKEKEPDFSAKDLRRLEAERLAEWIFINGEKHYIHNIVRNVTDKDPVIRKKMGIDGMVPPDKQKLFEVVKEMREQGGAKGRFRMKASIRIRDEFFTPGMKVKVHLPLPAEYFQISDVKILEYSEGCAGIDPPDSLYRAICFEDTLQENRTFYVIYEYTVTNRYHDFSDEDQIRTEKEKTGYHRPDPEGSLGEQIPHIRFTPYLKALADEIVGNEKNPLAIAGRIYDYITTNVKYSYMKQYALIPDIPQYCARNLRGDCGVQALLFITLCRICGVPARWQSGLYAAPESVGPHDWAMFYVKPYGWLFADPSFGGSAFEDGDEERRRFYFGNLDPFRMAANNAFQQPFSNRKACMPVDPYDNQTGEVETEEHGFSGRELQSERELLYSSI